MNQSCHGCTPSSCLHWATCQERNSFIARMEANYLPGPTFPETQENNQQWPEWPWEEEL